MTAGHKAAGAATVTGEDFKPADFITSEVGADRIELRLFGTWTVDRVGALDTRLRTISVPATAAIAIDLKDVTRLDTAGAWLIDRTRSELAERAALSEIVNASENHRLLLSQVSQTYTPCEIAPPKVSAFTAVLERAGRTTVAGGQELYELLSFSGQVIDAMFRTLLNPFRLRWTSLVAQMEQAGFNAVPIIALISFLIGAVLAYIGSDLLSQFGAQIYTVNLITYGFMREFGVLLTAIMIAGRSGSAMTAEIGSMKSNEEIDAMRTFGLDPIDILVVPRVLALVLVTPLLVLVSDFMGVFGGGLVSWVALDISPSLYLARVRETIEISYIMVGLIKAPIFAFVVATIACYEGMMVEGSAESVGRRTTQSVVWAIFWVIVLDAFLAIYFIEIGF